MTILMLLNIALIGIGFLIGYYAAKKGL